MEAICKFLAVRAAGQHSFSGRAMKEVITAFRDLGWRRNEARPEPNSQYARSVTGRETCLPWWTDPETGEDVRGMSTAMQLAFDRYMADLVPEPAKPAEEWTRGYRAGPGPGDR